MIKIKYYNLLRLTCLGICLLTTAAMAQRGIDSIMMLADSLADGEEKARQYHKIAKAFAGIERDSSEYFYLLARDQLKALDAPALVAESQAIAADIYRQDWSLDTLRELLERSSAYYRSVGNQEEYLVNLITLGAIYSNRSRYKEAIPYSLQALDLAKTLKDTLQQGKVAYNLGVVYYNTSLLDEAVEKFREAHEYFLSIRNESMAGIALSGVVNVYLNSENNDSALIYALELLALGDTLRYSRLQLSARSNLGAIYNNLGNYELAARYYREAEPFAKRFGSKLSLINCWCALGKSLAHLNQNDSSAYYFQKAYDLDAGENMPIMHHYCSKEYAEVLHRRGELKKSSDLLLQYIRYQDSVLAKENKEVIAGLEAKYQASQKDAEISAQKLTIAQRTAQRNRYLLGLLITVGLVGFLVYRFQQNQKLQNEKIANIEKYQKILIMDSMLQGQEEERKRIAQDLHDGLGTLLAAARMQMQNIQREIDKLGELQLVGKTEKLIDHACKEVRRISHDMMPSALIDLGLVAAIEDLVDEIRVQKDMVFDLRLPDEELNLDNSIALNLYRIVQEVLQNIVKHANANIVELRMEKSEDNLNITVKDDGQGFDGDHLENQGLGLNNIKSRVQYLSGQLNIDSQPGEGVSFNMTVPVTKSE